MSLVLDEDLTCKGSITARQGFSGPIARSTLTTDPLVAYCLPLTEFRIWDAFQTLLTTAGTDDLGITAGAFGTGCPYIHAGEMNAAGAVTRYARTVFELPPEYVAGGSIQINFAAGMLTSVASVSATVDVECYLTGRDCLKTGSDLVTTSATSINSVTFADKAFTVTPTGLVAGDTLDIRVTIAANSATASSHFACIAAAEVLLDVRG